MGHCRGFASVRFRPTRPFSFHVTFSIGVLFPAKRIKNTTEESTFVTVELRRGRTAVGTLMFYSQIEVDWGGYVLWTDFGGVALS